MTNRLEQLDMKVQAISQHKNQLEGRCGVLEEQISDLEMQLIDLKGDKEKYTKSVEFLQVVLASNQEIVRQSFEKIVTQALQYILEDDYYFTLEFGRRGNLGELNFNIISPDKKEPSDIIDSDAGGVIDVVSLALRLVLLEIAVPKVGGPLILDETFKHLSLKYQPRANEFLKTINKEFKRQLIFVTHLETFINNPEYNTIEIKGRE